MRRILVGVVFTVACAAGAPEAGPATPTEPAASSTAVAPPNEWQAACESCLAKGDNFTGDTCARECLQDTWCFGPGNRAAPTCPSEAPPDSAW